MALKMRGFTWKKDFELVRAFLILTYNLTRSFQNWIPSMFENIKFGPCGTEYRDEEDEYIKIWEKADDSDIPSVSKVAAVTFCKPSGDCWIQIHPDYRFNEKEIVLWIEEQRREIKSNETPELELRFYVDETDEKRKALLMELGYENSGINEYNRKRPIDEPVPEYQLPEGFKIRSVDVEEDFVQYKKVLEAVFPHCSRMTKRTAKIYSTASFYNRDLDLVAVDRNGNFAAFCTVRIDPASRMAELEPVGTHPDYRRLGLARSVICEGLRRLQKYHPSSICILGAATSEAANRLYESVGLTEKTEVHLWRKKLQSRENSRNSGFTFYVGETLRELGEGEVEVQIFEEEDIDPLDLFDLSDPKEALIVMYKEAYARAKKRKIEDYVSQPIYFKELYKHTHKTHMLVH